jgi:hypothetical protein
MQHNVNKVKAEKEFQAANELINSLRSKVDSTKAEISKASEEKGKNILICALNNKMLTYFPHRSSS